MLTLNDGRTELWQWDTGRMLSVDADCSQVHFSNKIFGRSIDVDVVNGVATIPDILLQADKDLTAWAFAGTPENGYTKISKVFKVNKRNKPADYVFTIPNQTTLGDILERIEDLENRPGADISEEEIQNAVSDYLEKNPISVEEKDPTVPDWAKKPEKPTYTPEEIGAQPAGDYALRDEIPLVPEMPEIPSALPNPHKLTFTGAVNAVYDGSKEVEVEIPARGGGEMRHIRTIELEEDMQWVYFDADSDGKPFDVKDLAINVYSVGAEGNTSENHFKIEANTKTHNASRRIADISSGIRKNGSTQSLSVVATCSGVNGYAIYGQQDNANIFNEDMKFLGFQNNMLAKNGHLFGLESATSLLFGSDSSSVLLGKGTKIAVWGR